VVCERRFLDAIFIKKKRKGDFLLSFPLFHLVEGLVVPLRRSPPWSQSPVELRRLRMSAAMSHSHGLPSFPFSPLLTFFPQFPSRQISINQFFLKVLLLSPTHTPFLFQEGMKVHLHCFFSRSNLGLQGSSSFLRPPTLETGVRLD